MERPGFLVVFHVQHRAERASVFHVQHLFSWRAYGPGVYSPLLRIRMIHPAGTEARDVPWPPHTYRRNLFVDKMLSVEYRCPVSSP
jgi:hypothetical protein